MRASEVMTQIPNCCMPSSTARTAATILRKFGLGALPVVEDYASRKLVGIITDRDLCIRALVDPDQPNEALVEDCMTRDPVCCGPDSDVRYVLALMATRGVRRVPVVDQDHRVVGMVTLTDLVHHNALPPQDLCAALARVVAPAKQTAIARAATAGPK
jgi:CBS domain-containing protein